MTEQNEDFNYSTINFFKPKDYISQAWPQGTNPRGWSVGVRLGFPRGVRGLSFFMAQSGKPCFLALI